jgi:hypothetical protein
MATTTLGEKDKGRLLRSARAVNEAKERLSTAHAEQQALWRELRAKGVSKAAIAAASGVTPMAVTYAIDPPPSRLARGANRR